MPIGALTKKTHSQPTYSVRTPPSSTPTAPPAPETAPQTASALLRSSPSANVVERIESAAGAIIAPPRPCTARAAISRLLVLAKPHASDATVKSARPIMKSLPAAEEVGTRPPSSRKPPNVRAYALATHCRLESVKCRSRSIVGSATLTIDTSMMSMNCVAVRRISAIQRRGSGVSDDIRFHSQAVVARQYCRSSRAGAGG